MTSDDTIAGFRALRRRARALVALLLLSYIGSRVMAALDVPQTIRFNDDSDWWSIANEIYPRPTTKPEMIDTNEANFRILGIPLGEDQFQNAYKKLGRSTAIERGDAGTSRHQVCYVDSKGPQRIHLILEKAEVDYSFYFFEGGDKWQGDALCLESPLSSTDLKTGTGVQLGQTPAQVEAILGKPTAVLQDELIYNREARKQTPSADLKGFGRSSPKCQ